MILPMFENSNQITMKKIIVSCIVLLGLNLFAQEGATKPNIVTVKPNPEEYFWSNPAFKPAKFPKELPIVLTQFNVSIPQDQKLFARTGSGKMTDEDASVFLQFRIANLDKPRFQKATDEMATYLLDELKSKGYTIGAYSDFSSGTKYPDMTKNPAPKGEKPDLFGPGFTVPGQCFSSKDGIMFSAFDQPIYPQQAMKAGYIQIEKKISLMYFGMVLNFLETESDIKQTTRTNSISIAVKGQLYSTVGGVGLSIGGPMGTGGFVLGPKYEKGKENLYSYGREFTTSINKETGDIMIDNDKFIAAYMELGKSYIDNMLEVMIIPTKK